MLFHLFVLFCVIACIFYHSLTILNVSRLHDALPKHLISCDCIVLTIIVGNIFCNDMGKWAQSDCMSSSLNFMNSKLCRCPISHAKRTIMKAQNPYTNETKMTTVLTSMDVYIFLEKINKWFDWFRSHKSVAFT